MQCGFGICSIDLFTYSFLHVETNKTRYGLAADQRVMMPELITQNIKINKNAENTKVTLHMCNQ